MKQIKIPIYICESNCQERQELVAIIRRYLMDVDGPLTLAYEGDDPEALQATMKQYLFPGIFFLSVNLLAGTDGVVLGQAIRQSDDLAKIIYVTHYPEAVYRILNGNIQAFDFIIKHYEATSPIPSHDMTSHMIRCLTEACRRLLTNYSAKTTFIFKIRGTYFALPHDQLISLETGPDAHQLTLQTRDGAISFYGGIRQTLEQLPRHFIQISRSEVVNLAHVVGKQLSQFALHLTDGRLVYISHRYYRLVKQALALHGIPEVASET